MKIATSYRMLVVPLAALLTAASPNCASVPLGPPDPAVTDDRLVGAWVGLEAVSADSCEVAHFVRFNEAEYLLHSGPKADDRDFVRAYFTRLDSALFLNLQDLENQSWSVYRIRFFTPDSASLSMLRDGSPPSATTEELRRYVIPRLNDPEMYGDSTTMVRPTRCEAG